MEYERERCFLMIHDCQFGAVAFEKLEVVMEEMVGQTRKFRIPHVNFEIVELFVDNVYIDIVLKRLKNAMRS